MTVKSLNQLVPTHVLIIVIYWRLKSTLLVNIWSIYRTLFGVGMPKVNGVRKPQLQTMNELYTTSVCPLTKLLHLTLQTTCHLSYTESNLTSTSNPEKFLTNKIKTRFKQQETPRCHWLDLLVELCTTKSYFTVGGFLGVKRHIYPLWQ